MAVDQEIRFCPVDGARVAYATVGIGPPLVLPASLGATHLELEWAFPEFRDFVVALARDRTVIRYDRLGTGLSDRTPVEVGLEAGLRTLEALVDCLGLEELSLLGFSAGGPLAAALAARRPDAVRCIAFFGAYADGTQIAPPALRDALLATMRAHWGAGSRALSDVWLPGAGAGLRERFVRLQRASATPEVAAELLEGVYDTDVRELLGSVLTPSLVLHRRDDHAIPFSQGRELASLLPDARLVALEGEMHPPWLGDTAPVLGQVAAFLHEHHPTGRRAPEVAAAETPLSARETEVLRLVAEGLSDAEIAARLVVSPHTVHRHVANIRTKLGQASRAAAVAHAARLGLI